MTETVQALIPLSAYQQSRAHLFPSIESIRWFVRQHQRDLIEAGGLLMITGRHMVSPAEFDAAVLNAGRRAASSKVAA